MLNLDLPEDIHTRLELLLLSTGRSHHGVPGRNRGSLPDTQPGWEWFWVWGAKRELLKFLMKRREIACGRFMLLSVKDCLPES